MNSFRSFPTPRTPGRLRRGVAGGLAAVTLAAALVAPGVARAQTQPTTGSDTASTAPDLVTQSSAIPLPGEAASASGGPWDVAVSRNAVWALAPRAGAVYRIDPKTNRVAARVELPALGCIPGRCRGVDRIVATPRDVWVVNNDAGSLVHIDARRNKVAGSIPIASGSLAPPVPDATGVWVTTDGSVGDIVHIDAKTHEVTDTVHIGVAPVWPAAMVNGTLWASGSVMHPGAPPDETLYQVDPSTATVVRTVPGASGLATLLGDDLWLNRDCCPSVTQVDGATGTPGLDVRVDGFSGFLTAGGGSVWVRLGNHDHTEQWIARVNPVDGTTVRYGLSSPNAPGGLAFGHGALWVADWAANVVRRMPVPAR